MGEGVDERFASAVESRHLHDGSHVRADQTRGELELVLAHHVNVEPRDSCHHARPCLDESRDVGLLFSVEQDGGASPNEPNAVRAPTHESVARLDGGGVPVDGESHGVSLRTEVSVSELIPSRIPPLRQSCYNKHMSFISERHFYQYATCPNWIYRSSSQDPVREISHLEARLLMDGLLPEVHVTLLGSRAFEEIDEEDHDEAFTRTIEAMERGAQTILHGALIHGQYLSRPDLLERVEGRSRFGDYYYVACDIKRARKVRSETELVGVFHAEVLRLIQGVRPTQGYVMNPDGNVTAFLIEASEGNYEVALSDIERLMAGEEPARHLSSRCKHSPWAMECQTRAEDCDDLSRINRIWEEEADALRSGGYKTVSALARSAENTLKQKVTSLSVDRLLFLRRQARALISGEVDLIEPIKLPSALFEIYFDIEADPLRDLEYLFGVLEVRRGAMGVEEKTYTAFLAKSPSEERSAWEAFVGYLIEHPDVPIFHYGFYEVEVVRRLGQKYGTDPKVLEDILYRLFDLLAPIRPAVLFPLSFYTLKDLAAFIGFSWRNVESSGINSILWYEDWLAYNDEAKLRDVLEYNEDDTRATHALKRWLEVHAM